MGSVLEPLVPVDKEPYLSIVSDFARTVVKAFDSSLNAADTRGPSQGQDRATQVINAYVHKQPSCWQRYVWVSTVYYCTCCLRITWKLRSAASCWIIFNSTRVTLFVENGYSMISASFLNLLQHTKYVKETSINFSDRSAYDLKKLQPSRHKLWLFIIIVKLAK